MVNKLKDEIRLMKEAYRKYIYHRDEMIKKAKEKYN